MLCYLLESFGRMLAVCELTITVVVAVDLLVNNAGLFNSFLFDEAESTQGFQSILVSFSGSFQSGVRNYQSSW